MRILTLAAVLPAIALGIYIYKKDRSEKEPWSLLLILLACGAAVCIPAGYIEMFLGNILQFFFGRYPYGFSRIIYNFIENFFVVALVEEGLKFLALYFVTRKNKNFNSLFDGLLYAVFVSLGFAAYENIGYVFKFGLSAALMRAVTAVPAHCFFGVMMGYQYSMWHMYKKAEMKEKELKVYGLIDGSKKPFSGDIYMALSIIVPVAAHGLYDFCASGSGILSNVIFYAFLIFMYVFSFRKVHEMSKYDTDDEQYTDYLIVKKYPFLADILRRKAATGANPGTSYNAGNGNVTYRWPSGSSYTGQWSNNTMNGYGVYIFNNPYCLRYEGNFVNGKFEGYGVLLYKNGSRFEGNWYKNMKHGRGRIVYPDGRTRDGLWEYDVLRSGPAK